MWLITSDLHLSSNPRDAYRFVFLDWLLKLIRKEHVSTLIVMGDLTTDKDRHTAWLVNEIADKFYDIAQECEVIVLKGNHDYLSEDEPFFQFLDHIKRIKFYSSIVNLPNMVFLPHTRDYKMDWEDFIKTKFSHDKFVFAHQTFEGANVGKRKMEGIPLSIFGPGTHVFSGDIHVPQQTGVVTYTGAPYTVNFGDDYEGRVILLDPDTGKTKSIPYPGPQKWLVECIGLSGPKGEFQKGDLLKVRVSLTAKEYEDWKNIRADIKAWADKRGIIANPILPVVTTRKAVTYKNIDTQTDTELVTSFAKRSKISPSTLKVGLNILKET